MDIGSTTGIQNNYLSFLESRPRRWENAAIELIARLTKKFRTRSHIVHLSSSDALKTIAESKSTGVSLTAETCPHYLTLNSEDIEASNTSGKTIFKCCPPIREKNNQEKLWKAVKEGLIDFVVSDHSPCTPALRLLESTDFAKAWGGISGLQFTLPLVWTHGQNHGLKIEDLAEILCEKPARWAGLKNKGSLAKGFDADIVVWNPEESFEVKKEIILHKNKQTPYANWNLKGRVQATFVRGQKVFENGKVIGRPSGSPLLKG
jgi:allantoinase